MVLKVKKLSAQAILPAYQHQGDAALDLYAAEDKILLPGKVENVSTGIALEIPVGMVGNIRDRSGLAAKHGLHTLAGVVDSNYRGEIFVVIINLGTEDYQIKVGDRIAQMLIQPIERVEIKEADNLADSDRGENRFGSSGY